MDEHTATSHQPAHTVGSRSKDSRWVIVAVVDPTLRRTSHRSDLTVTTAH